jgi:hypothetical protein
MCLFRLTFLSALYEQCGHLYNFPDLADFTAGSPVLPSPPLASSRTISPPIPLFASSLSLSPPVTVMDNINYRYILETLYFYIDNKYKYHIFL